MIFDWFVIGAGPAGISSIGHLLDRGAEKIGWMDPHFSVGDLGSKWSVVESNTTVHLFLRFLHGCKSFQFVYRPFKFPIESLDPKETCKIEQIVHPLQWISDHLRQKVYSFRKLATDLIFKNECWHINSTYRAKNVILAVGAEPQVFPHQAGELISLEVALDPNKLSKIVEPNDVVAVFGGSHSAILAIENLLKCGVKQVTNFYRSPHRYAVYFDDWILYDNTGLKGSTAKWAKANLDTSLPSNLKRFLISDPHFDKHLASCSKTIYAIGFERRISPLTEMYSGYDETTGIIAPGLFGCGIAYPELRTDRAGNTEKRVGLWKFMEHLNAVMPIWEQTPSLAQEK